MMRCFNLVLIFLWVLGATSVPAADTAADPAQKKSRKKAKTIHRLRVYVESRHDIPERTLAANVGETDPMQFMVEKLPILTENHVQRAALVEDVGGYQVQVQFNTLGTRILESYTSAAAGRHLLIMTEIEGDARWIAAPLIRRRIGDGSLVFVPSASREHMDLLVRGLNDKVEKDRKMWLN